MTNNSGDKRIKEQVGNMQVNFDKEAAWMRLQDRLESKDEKKPYFRIAWAAAAMLLVATTLWYSFRDTQEVTVAKEKSEVMTSIVSVPAEIESEGVRVSDIQQVQKEKKQELSAKMQLKPVEIIKEVTPLPEPIVVKEEPAPIPEPVKTVAAPKPKMKVVHINEVMQDRERARIMRDIYVIEEQLKRDQRTYELPEEDRNISRPPNLFKTNRIIQN